MEPITPNGNNLWSESFITRYAQELMSETNTQSELGQEHFAAVPTSLHTILANKIGGFDPSKYALEEGKNYYVTPEVAQKIFSSNFN